MSKKPVIQPWSSIDDQVDDQDIAAVKALAAGVANEGQQKMVLALIINRIAGTYDMSFRPGGPEGDRASSFAEGKRYVGNALVRLMKLTTNAKPKP